MLTCLNSCKSVLPRSQSVGPWVLRARERSDVGSRSACYAELIPANNVTQKVSYVLVPRRMQWSQRKDAVQQMKRAVDAAGIGKWECFRKWHVIVRCTDGPNMFDSARSVWSLGASALRALCNRVSKKRSSETLETLLQGSLASMPHVIPICFSCIACHSHPRYTSRSRPHALSCALPDVR